MITVSLTSSVLEKMASRRWTRGILVCSAFKRVKCSFCHASRSITWNRTYLTVRKNFSREYCNRRKICSRTTSMPWRTTAATNDSVRCASMWPGWKIGLTCPNSTWAVSLICSRIGKLRSTRSPIVSSSGLRTSQVSQSWRKIPKVIHREKNWAKSSKLNRRNRMMRTMRSSRSCRPMLLWKNPKNYKWLRRVRKANHRTQ